MHNVLHQVWEILLNASALFCWIPMVWLAAKIFQRLQENSEKKRQAQEDLILATLKKEPWHFDPSYWSRLGPLVSNVPEAQGDFYVESEKCVACGASAAAAPDLIRFREASQSTMGCYFIKQPSTSAEVDQAVAAIKASCDHAVRYRGNDPAILVRISPISVDNPFRYRPTD
jgi:ferredoxin